MLCQALLHVLTHFILTTIPESVCCYNTHFKKSKTEAQGGEGTRIVRKWQS